MSDLVTQPQQQHQQQPPWDQGPPPPPAPPSPPAEPLSSHDRAMRAAAAPLHPGRKRGANPEVSRVVQERLLQGEELAAVQIEQQYNVSRGFLRSQIAQLEREGNVFQEFRRPGSKGEKSFRLKKAARGAAPTVPADTTASPDLPPVDENLAKTQQVINALLGGYRLTAHRVAMHWNTDPALVRKAVAALRRQGTHVAEDRDGRHIVYYVETGRPRTGQAVATTTAPVPPAAAGALPPVPALGQDVQVFLTSMDPDEDGSVLVGLRNGHGSWMAKIVGYMADEE